jgi:ppGpp synthetase/RelA/SpoT-type nucleotidyltranferase
MKDKLNDICVRLTDEISDSLSKCGLMYRIFSRVKTVDSIRHKLNVKYADKKVKIQDMIGIRIVLYFQDDVDALAVYYSAKDVVKKSIDEYDSSTFKPQRLNITRLIPEDMAEDFTAAVPEEFKDLVEPTYEIQIRTVFSEGGHGVEKDLRNNF